jgi:hypothetical protein
LFILHKGIGFFQSVFVSCRADGVRGLRGGRDDVFADTEKRKEDEPIGSILLHKNRPFERPLPPIKSERGPFWISTELGISS